MSWLVTPDGNMRIQNQNNEILYDGVIYLTSEFAKFMGVSNREMKNRMILVTKNKKPFDYLYNAKGRSPESKVKKQPPRSDRDRKSWRTESKEKIITKQEARKQRLAEIDEEYAIELRKHKLNTRSHCLGSRGGYNAI